ncbi:hypothetical protein JVU11DRAFT_7328 [Chiua virens]|nr:hypothetical protein JVU11DRAFT_7328 [Chiua virens]
MFKLPTICAAAGSDSMTSTSTSNASSSRIDALPSPSKIPLPVSPIKRPSTTQFGSTKSFLFLGSNCSATGTSGGILGRSLKTLSHALDKLVVPPASQPNTSMGFVRADGGSEDSTPETRKGKGKAKDDMSLPSTFAWPTASSLKRTATGTFGTLRSGFPTPLPSVSISSTVPNNFLTGLPATSGRFVFLLARLSVLPKYQPSLSRQTPQSFPPDPAPSSSLSSRPALPWR